MYLSDYANDELQDHKLNSAYTSVSQLYLGLATASPTSAGTGASFNEVPNAGGYARATVDFSAANGRRIQSSNVVQFAKATDNWGTVTHWALLDSGTYGAGNMLAFGTIAPRIVSTGKTPSFQPGQVYVGISSGAMSDYLAGKLLDFMFRDQFFAVPDTWFSLCLSVVSDVDTGSTINEPVGGSYARVQVDVNGGTTPTWALASAQLVDNADAVSSPVASGSWGTLTSIALCDASTVGNLLVYINLDSDDYQLLSSGDSVNFPAGDLAFGMT